MCSTDISNRYHRALVGQSKPKPIRFALSCALDHQEREEIFYFPLSDRRISFHRRCERDLRAKETEIIIFFLQLPLRLALANKLLSDIY